MTKHLRGCNVVKFFVPDSIEEASLTSSSCGNEKLVHLQQTRKTERERERECSSRNSRWIQRAARKRFACSDIVRETRASERAESRSSGLRRCESAKKAITRNAKSNQLRTSGLREGYPRSRELFAGDFRERATERFGSRGESLRFLFNFHEWGWKHKGREWGAIGRCTERHKRFVEACRARADLNHAMQFLAMRYSRG